MLDYVCASTVYLQNEYEEVNRFASLVDVVQSRALVAVVELDLLDDVRVPQNPQ